MVWNTRCRRKKNKTKKRKKENIFFSLRVLHLVPRPVPQRLLAAAPLSVFFVIAVRVRHHGVGGEGRVGGPLPSERLPRVGRAGHRCDVPQQRLAEVGEVLFAVGVFEVGARLFCIIIIFL